MAEYIEKQAAIDELCHVDEYNSLSIATIKEMKPADVRPVVRGRWEMDSDGLDVCSECGEVALQRVFIRLPDKIIDLQTVRSKYCPNCGADMMGESKEEKDEDD